MNIPNECARIEAALQGAGVSVAAMCREAGINTSTWQRWKNGVTDPGVSVWSRVNDAAGKLAGQ